MPLASAQLVASAVLLLGSLSHSSIQRACAALSSSWSLCMKVSESDSLNTCVKQGEVERRIISQTCTIALVLQTQIQPPTTGCMMPTLAEQHAQHSTAGHCPWADCHPSTHRAALTPNKTIINIGRNLQPLTPSSSIMQVDNHAGCQGVCCGAPPGRTFSLSCSRQLLGRDRSRWPLLPPSTQLSTEQQQQQQQQQQVNQQHTDIDNGKSPVLCSTFKPVQPLQAS